MPRISSEKTRQVILVRDPVFDDTLVPERLALFDEEFNMVSINLVNKGNWDPTLAYAENEIVSHDGSSYLAKQAIAANLEGNTTPDLDTDNWTLLAAKGLPGVEGLNWRGDWNSFDEYVDRDAVYYGGSSWRAVRPINPGGELPGAAYGVMPGASVYAGTEADLWDPDWTTATPHSDTLNSSVDPVTPGGTVYNLFKFTVDTDGTIDIHVVYAGLDGYLELYSGSGAFVAGNDDAGNAATSHLTRAVTAGVYYVVFRNRNSGATNTTYVASITPSAGATLIDDPGPPWTPLALEGDVGAQGIQGVQGVPGPVSNWRGVWDSGSAYEDGDSVHHEGSAYWCIGTHPAGSSPEPGIDPDYVDLGDTPVSGTQHAYFPPPGEVINGPIGISTSGQGVGGADDVNWFKIIGEPGASVTITPTDAQYTAWSDAGVYNLFPPSGSTGARTVTIPASGVFYVEVGPVDTSGGVDPWSIKFDYTSLADIPTWSLMAEKGETGDTGPSGEGVPVGGADGDVLTKLSATDGDVGWEPPGGGGAPIAIYREQNLGSIAVPAGTNQVVDTLTFTLDATRLVHLFAAAGHSDPPSSHTFDFALDDVSLAGGGNNSSSVNSYGMYVGSSGGPAVGGGVTADANLLSGGVWRVLAAGTHTLKHRTTRGSSGGTTDRRTLMAVVYDTPITDT